MPEDFYKLYEYCENKKINISGIMCIPPFNKDQEYFKKCHLLEMRPIVTLF